MHSPDPGPADERPAEQLDPDEPRGAVTRRAETRALWAAGIRPQGRWEIHLGHPGAAPGQLTKPLTPTALHLPTILVCPSTATRPRRFRGACLRCEHEGPDRSGAEGEAQAIEDAHDHAFPQWRTLPAVRPAPAAAEYDPVARSRWRRQIDAAYPAGWFDRGGPIVMLREQRPYRSHRQAPGGGYEITRLTSGDDSATQEALF